MPSDRARIASLVRAELAMAGISGRKLAERMGWPVDGTLRRLRGDVAFRADELMAIARELDVPAAKFVQPAEPTAAAS